MFFFLFFFNDTATTEIYTLSLHDALPISKIFLDYDNLAQFADNHEVVVLASQLLIIAAIFQFTDALQVVALGALRGMQDRKSTRLNSSHVRISYAVFCLKKKTKKKQQRQQ